MAATLVPSEMFDLQALDKDNYERWRFWVETYLVAEKLWEVVEGTRKPPKQEDGEAIFMAWLKNNARVLHIIILFCGEDANSCIRESETAKETWNTLAEEFSTPEIFETLGASTEVDPNDDDTSSNDGTAELIKEELEGSFPMFQYTENNEWEPLRKFVEQNPETVREKVCWGMTPLQYAISSMKICSMTVDGIKVLLAMMKKKDLDIVNGIQIPIMPYVPASSDTQDGDVCITIPKENNSEASHKLLIRKVNCFKSVLTLLHILTGINSTYQKKLLHSQTEEIMGYIRELPDYNHMPQKLVQEALFQAVERGHVMIIKAIIRCNQLAPSWFHALRNENDKTLLQFAAEHRQAEIFNLIYCYRGKENVDMIGRKDKFDSNILHVVGKLPPLRRIVHIRGAALQMQYELQWFKDVESRASPKDLSCINHDSRTPHEEFTVHHRDLVQAGEKSMKETATSSALVAALIITIMFAAVVTVPGGIDEHGIPIHLYTKSFRIFMITDVISLCLATTSVMVFLGILTSRVLPKKIFSNLGQSQAHSFSHLNARL